MFKFSILTLRKRGNKVPQAVSLLLPLRNGESGILKSCSFHLLFTMLLNFITTQGLFLKVEKYIITYGCDCFLFMTKPQEWL